MQRIVASQVNAAGSLDNPKLQEVKARSVNLRCTFVFDTAQPPAVASNRQDIVKQAQTRLKALGFDSGPVDGMLGLRTREALRWFQLANGLPADGALDEATRRALGIE
jgi:peptidoglycan hydrolase-like protein with peptidoglycan-binding domain